MLADLTAQNRYQDIQVQNTGSDTAYVAIQIYRVNHPGTPQQSFTTLNDNPYQIGLIATPNKMVIPAGQMRISRILYIGNPLDVDGVYEVKFTPVSGQLVAVGGPGSEVAAGVQLVIAYGVSIFVRPANLNPNIQASRNGTSLVLNNTGNTSVTIANCKQCQGSNCQAVPLVNVLLYPGSTKTYTLPQNQGLQCLEEVLQNQYFPFKIP